MRQAGGRCAISLSNRLATDVNYLGPMPTLTASADSITTESGCCETQSTGVSTELGFLGGTAGLLRDLRATRISMQPQPLRMAAKSYAIHERESAVDLGDPVWTIDGGDLFRSRLNVRYGLMQSSRADYPPSPIATACH